MVEHYILGIFFKLKLFSVFFFLALFKASIILLFPFLSLFRVLLICEHNFFCFFSCFRYLSELKRLNGISFVISAGSSVAIVGTSGSGKASMILTYILAKYYIKKLPWTVWFYFSFSFFFCFLCNVLDRWVNDKLDVGGNSTIGVSSCLLSTKDILLHSKIKDI